MKRAAIAILRCYQWGISPWLPRACRFYPSCSQYAVEAVEQFGLARGGWLALRRLSRCHPFHAGGYDPVPEAAVTETEPPRGRKRQATPHNVASHRCL